MSPKMELALEAIKIEQGILKENVGCQDQVMAAHGGFSRVDFLPNTDIRLTPIILNHDRLNEFQRHLLLYFTGFSRTASEIAREQIALTKDRKSELKAMYDLVGEAVSTLTRPNSPDEFGLLLHESWKLKRSLTSRISSRLIDEIYQTARRAGAIGGKLLGAGGGGFMLLFAKPEDHPRISEALHGLLRVPFSFETMGSQIIFYQPDELMNRDYPSEVRFRGVMDPTGTFQPEQVSLPLRNQG
jgi:D-glycero-alpha-D-manno-heptose-7-phosphate kinase